MAPAMIGVVSLMIVFDFPVGQRPTEHLTTQASRCKRQGGLFYSRFSASFNVRHTCGCVCVSGRGTRPDVSPEQGGGEPPASRRALEAGQGGAADPSRQGSRLKTSPEKAVDPWIRLAVGKKLCKTADRQTKAPSPPPPWQDRHKKTPPDSWKGNGFYRRVVSRSYKTSRAKNSRNQRRLITCDRLPCVDVSLSLSL